MPKRTDITSILVIGSGPIVIGQACEFDYSGTQAIKVLQREGYRVILVNSNPATIMTDPEFAYRTYIEPLTPATVEMIIAREKPDALLPTLGGQTSLNIAVALHQSGVLEKYNVELIGAKFDAIQRAEDRALFKQTMEHIGLELPRGEVVTNIDQAMQAAENIGFPIIIRPSYTLGGIGGGIVYNMDEYREQIARALQLSPIHSALVEESIIGWKEFELEVMRDLKDNVVIICSIENFDPMGVHTGDSITVAPIQTLTDQEYQRLRDYAIKIIRAIGVETGGSNIQFAVHPTNGRVVVIEMNPRVSRSSALASKATGYPIAKIAALLSVGYTLDELPNDITGSTPASFEPTIDYVVVKIPRWDFEKFPLADPSLNTYMKSIGEVMAIGRTFKEALQKGIRGLEIGRYGLGESPNDPDDVRELNAMDSENALIILREKLRTPLPDRLLYLRSALYHGMALQDIADITGIDPWFLSSLEEIVATERTLKAAAEKGGLEDAELIRAAKRQGFSDKQLSLIAHTSEESIRQFREQHHILPVYKMVDTCAAEFASSTPYYYSTYERESEVTLSDKKRIMILGGGPNRIGQGIEFDYCCVHGVMALRELGYETIMVNSNPETVSTDYDTADKLYFEPLTLEDVLNIVQVERPIGVIMQFGGQTPLRLALPLQKAGVPILGTSPDSIDMAEDRERFGALLQKLKIPFPEYGTANSESEALEAAHRIGYPVLVRPSYVLGGRAMQIVYNDTDLCTFMREAVRASPDHPVLIDKFLEDAYEFDVDAISDGEQTVIGGIMQHIEEAGVHSGDSACVLPPYALLEADRNTIREYTYRIADALKVRGLMNIQFALRDGVMYVLEVNPRASRTVPFVSKVTGIPLAKVAAKVIVGITLEEQGFTEEVAVSHVAVKESVFPFDKFSEVISYLGPEMRSTGEVMGVHTDFGLAFWKAQESVGAALPLSGTVFVSVNDHDKPRILPLVQELAELGFSIMATKGTAAFLQADHVTVETVLKVDEGRPNIVDRIVDGDVQLVINTPLGPQSRADEYAIGQTAISRKIPIITTLSGAAASVKGIQAMQRQRNTICSIQEYHENIPALKNFRPNAGIAIADS